MERAILHVDVNSAFLSWEAVYRIHHLGGTLDLREVPSAVGGDQEKRHGIILAKSIPAKKYKIHTGESVLDAKRKCPGIILVPPNYGLYQRSSKALMKILLRYTSKIEQYSIDEAFMDITGTEKIFGNPEKVANEIRETVYKELGFTVNIGVSSNKILAKMASDFRKPNLVHTLWPHEIEQKMWPLPVRNLFFVGHATEAKLHSLGIRTIGDIAVYDPAILQAHMHKHGLLVWQYANGQDITDVIDIAPPNKGYGNSTTIAFDVTDAQTAKLVLLSLSETVSARLRADNAKISVVAVGIRDYNLNYSSCQTTLSTSTDLTIEIYQAACRCFDELWSGIPIRHLGVHTERVDGSECRQISLFDKIDYGKQKRAEMAVDELRRRYGIDCIKRASFIESPSANKKGKYIDHMSGGISREKRSVDYSKEIIV
ncbi:MAG: DNA polymerase IV [Enterocloster asparagiformis]|nr:DNA polymerase IV [Enterocloster asparagiformis]